MAGRRAAFISPSMVPKSSTIGRGPAAFRKGRAAQEQSAVLGVLADDRRMSAARTFSPARRRLRIRSRDGRPGAVFRAGQAQVGARQRLQARQGNRTAASPARDDPGGVDQHSPGGVADTDFPAAAARAAEPSVELSDGIHRERPVEPGVRRIRIDGALPAAPGTLHQDTLDHLHARCFGERPRRLRSSAVPFISPPRRSWSRAAFSSGSRRVSFPWRSLSRVCS